MSDTTTFESLHGALQAATVIPGPVDVAAIAEEAIQAAFGLIAERLEQAGVGPVSGDFDPGEASTLQAAFDLFVRAMLVNAQGAQGAIERETEEWFARIRSGDPQAVEDAILELREHALPEGHPLAID